MAEELVNERRAAIALLTALADGKHQSYINGDGQVVVVNNAAPKSALSIRQQQDLWELTDNITTRHSSIAIGFIR